MKLYLNFEGIRKLWQYTKFEAMSEGSFVLQEIPHRIDHATL